MSLWDKYKVSTLPEEQRAEVIKVIAHEQEETVRARINNSNHQVVRGLGIAAIFCSTIVVAVGGYYWLDNWKEVKIKSMTPMVCPVPPPCSATPLPAFDIKVVPAAPAASK